MNRRTIILFTLVLAAGGMFVWTIAAQVQVPVVTNVVNGASYAPSLAPGALASIFGSNLSNPTTVPVSVIVNGRLAAVLSAVPTQLNVQLPVDAAPGATTLQVTTASGSSVPFPTTLNSYAPGIFSLNGSGSGMGVFVHQNGGTLVGNATPAQPGETLILYAVGLGPTTPTVATGMASPTSPVAATNTPVAVSVGGVDGAVIFSGLTPGSVGIYRVTFQVPVSLVPGTHPVVLRVGGVSSNVVTVPLVAAQGTNGPPTVTGVVPGSGVTATQAFTFSFSDPNGWQDLGVVNILVNFWLDGQQSCYLAYSRPANTLYLINNAGNGYAGSMPLNGSGTLSNSQCIISGAGSSVSGGGNTMNLTLNMTFPASFAGTRIIYGAARDLVENNSGWQRMGVWKVPGAAQTTTTAVAGMNPARGSGAGATFTFTFTDTLGANDLGVMNVLVNDWLDGRHACYLAYARGNNMLYLMNDNGDALLPGKALNGSGSLGNSQCTVNGVGSAASANGNTLTLMLNMTFGPGFAGNRVFYLAARDVNELNNTGWQAMGSWTVQ